jgi:hypothetical protein
MSNSTRREWYIFNEFNLIKEFNINEVELIP